MSNSTRKTAAQKAAEKKADEAKATADKDAQDNDQTASTSDEANTGTTVSPSSLPDEGRAEPPAPKEDGPDTPGLDPEPGKHEAAAPKPDGVEAGDTDAKAPVVASDLTTGAPLEAAIQLPHDNDDLTDEAKELSQDLEKITGPTGAASEVGTAVPQAANQEPPADAPEPEEEDEEENRSSTEAAAERLRNAPEPSTITVAGDYDGELFTDSRKGFKRCNARIFEHTTATVYDRPMTRLLFAQGSEVSDAAAKEVLDTLGAQKNDEGGDVEGSSQD